jgi:hypothetical protein
MLCKHTWTLTWNHGHYWQLIGEWYVDGFMEEQAIFSMPTVTPECVEDEFGI